MNWEVWLYQSQFSNNKEPCKRKSCSAHLMVSARCMTSFEELTGALARLAFLKGPCFRRQTYVPTRGRISLPNMHIRTSTTLVHTHLKKAREVYSRAAWKGPTLCEESKKRDNSWIFMNRRYVSLRHTKAPRALPFKKTTSGAGSGREFIVA